jgi:3-deoxy-7-phosphoheptulonate synthase
VLKQLADAVEIRRNTKRAGLHERSA